MRGKIDPADVVYGVGCLCVVVGVALVSVPSALIAAGVLAILPVAVGWARGR